MIKYKLTRQDRTSCIIHPKSRFCCKYLKDTVVTADPQTPGVFTFNTKTQAENFQAVRARSGLILRVQPIGKGKSPMEISWDTDQRGLIRFFKNFASKVIQSAPEGTICYPGVLVLD